MSIDPLQPWLQCIQWVQEAFLAAGESSGLLLIYERYGFYGVVVTESEKYRWMGPKRYDYAGTKMFLQHRSYEAEIAYLEVESEKDGFGPKRGPWFSKMKAVMGLSREADREICLANCSVCNMGKEEMGSIHGSVFTFKEESEEKGQEVQEGISLKGINDHHQESGSVVLKFRRLMNVNNHDDQYDTSSRMRSRRSSRSSMRNVVINVDKFGAKSDVPDDSQAFLKAWKKACSTKQSIFLVPARKVYHLKPIILEGPCQSGIIMRIRGSIRASTHMSDYKKGGRVWIKFEKLRDFTVDGGGVISGNGQIWWPKSCKVDKTQPCVGAPTALTFDKCTNLKVTHLKIKNAQQKHVTFQDCLNVEASNLK